MKSNVRAIALAAMLALVGCGDDGVSPGALSQEEAAELASAVFSQSLAEALAVDVGSPAQTAGGPQLATYSETVEVSGPCPLGGQVALTGAVDGETDDATGAGTIDFTLTIAHAACVVQGEQGTQFTLTGNPSIVLDLSMTTDGQEGFTLSGSMNGLVDYAIDGGDSGSCQFAYGFSGESTASGFAFQTTGSVCGVDVSRTVTVSG